MDFTPPSFSLGISPKKEAGTVSIARVYYQRTHQGTRLDDRLAKSLESPRQMHKMEKEKAGPENAKGGHSKTKPSIKSRKQKEKGTGIKAAVEQNSERNTFSMENLFEYEHEEEDKRLWVFREGFMTFARADQDVESPIVDMALEKGSTDLSKAFKTAMDLERDRYS
ncbi:hypothetical protein Cgig2_022628 [Carnegiea gigantea]|uniref:Uncharacterized protein n=1 Tax=Carnegiea gigantea TaxID=171969 RepID=A0A9Q1GIZ1_9CARY|nr:hypothetical protein Cgig2_027295 [Carnegiea gigantea]KAJ8432984.1 hypothetical protein Cgig2_022628 [Carnegiea gigantea]